MKGSVTANGASVEGDFPVSLLRWLEAQDLLPRSVVVELNGEAVAPSEFASRELHDGDRLEIVRIVAVG